MAVWCHSKLEIVKVMNAANKKRANHDRPPHHFLALLWRITEKRVDKWERLLGMPHCWADEMQRIKQLYYRHYDQDVEAAARESEPLEENVSDVNVVRIPAPPSPGKDCPTSAFCPTFGFRLKCRPGRVCLSGWRRNCRICFNGWLWYNGVGVLEFRG